ncbi:hypothetical protein [Azohydromonas lata]|uniref:SGNH/GDSL hydrolase family protein n=1 Tax=Azohydromonas lata TaxID=45677 RepID=A0ABU5IKJ6_9BURK|nr:hypothetical protein [Azohydromonas lata]MDZ5459414.1 hypothetical protein [Azohydromonas lata]
MRHLTARAFLLWFMGATLVVLLALALLPHDGYVRYQLVSRESVHYLRLKWIYERIHFDDTPIDVAFIGTSHTQSGIDDARVEAGLRELGVAQRVVNFAVPHLGRDMEFVVARELLAHRRVRTLVVELQEAEARAPHPGFQRLGLPLDFVQAPLLLNTGLFENLVRLPLRQAKYALASAMPGAFGVQPGFDPATYEGPHWNDTYVGHGFTEPRTRRMGWEFHQAELMRLRRETDGKEALARRLDALPLEANLLFRYNEIYLRRIAELARAKGTQVVFLYLPAPDARRLPRVARWTQAYGPLLDARELLRSSTLWQNADHVNVYGAHAVSDWMAAQLAGQGATAAAARQGP